MNDKYDAYGAYGAGESSNPGGGAAPGPSQPEPHKCQLCEKTLPRFKSDAVRHMLANHGEEIGAHPYKCFDTTCKHLTFSRPDALWRHVDTVHVGVVENPNNFQKSIDDTTTDNNALAEQWLPQAAPVRPETQKM